MTDEEPNTCESSAVARIWGDGPADLTSHSIAKDEPTPIWQLNPAVPSDLATILAKAMSKAPTRRRKNGQACPPGLGPSPAQPARRPRSAGPYTGWARLP